MLGALDISIIVVYFLAVAAIGYVAGRGQRSTEDCFLGGRRTPWWAAGLSIIATETSAATFIGVPAQSLRGDWTYLQTTMGSVLARFVVAGLLIGLYYRARVVTVYDWLGARFGAGTRSAATGLFLIGRVLGSGVRTYMAAIALWVVTGIPFPAGIALVCVVAMLYTVSGGIRAVIWTDVLQGLLIFVGGGAALIAILADQGGGLREGAGRLLEGIGSAAGSAGDPAGKFRLFDFSPDPRRAFTFWSGIIAVCVFTVSTHGTDQDMIQRSLTCRDARAGRRSLWLSAVLALPVASLFLAIGSALWLRLGDDGARSLAQQIAAKAGEANYEKAYDYLFPWFVMTSLPAGVKGLVTVGIFATAMGSLDSAMNALATTTTRCVLAPWLARGRPDAYYVTASRWLTVFFAAVLAGVAVLVWLLHDPGSQEKGFGVLALGLEVLTWIFPPLLGVHLLGALTRRGSDRGNLLALTVGIGLILAARFSQDLFGLPSPWVWSWNAVIGCAVTFGIGALFPGRGHEEIPA